MKLKSNPTLVSLAFWKRKPDSVEQVDRLSIMATEEAAYELDVNGAKSHLDVPEVQHLLDTLLIDDKSAFSEEYLGYKYEDNIQNYQLKFFLTLDFSDGTYRILKGILPFKQPHYQDVISLFQPFFTGKKA